VALAVPVAGLAGAALPGCECGSVLVAARLISRGVSPPAALAFLSSAPAINPVVLVATAVAFPGQPAVVLARFGASLAAAVLVGFASPWLGPPGRAGPDLAPARRARVTNGTASFAGVFVHDLLQAGGFLVVGAAATAALQVAGRGRILASAGTHGAAGVLMLALLAVVLCVCSEADAFVAASLTQFSMTARLAFMVVGPVVDLKLVALQVSTFGPRFAIRFALLAFCVAILTASLAGGWIR
jgi:uncharacterized membrane protein YraQ (UPF0718 family)